MKAWEVTADKLVKAVAEELKGKGLVQSPEWVGKVKTGMSKERLPEQSDFWFVRCASLLRTLSLRQVGVRRLRHKYGGKREHRVSRPHHFAGSGKIIRVALQQLEKAGFVAKVEKKGRVLTPRGQSFLDKVAANFLPKEQNKQAVEAVVAQ